MCTMCESGARGGQKRGSDALELELQTVVNTMWVLGTKPLSSASTAVLLTTEPSLEEPLGWMLASRVLNTDMCY